MRTLRWTSLALAGVVAAILVTPVRAQQVEIKPAAKVKRDKYILTADEIAERPEISNAYDAVKLLRPNFLKPTRARGTLGANASDPSARPKIDYRSLGGDGGSGSSGGSAGSSGDPYKPSGAGAGRESGGTSPYGSASGGTNNQILAVLYLDDVKQENVEEMRNVPVATVIEIKFMAGTEASGRYGSGHEAGAILVKTKRAGTGQ